MGKSNDSKMSKASKLRQILARTQRTERGCLVWTGALHPEGYGGIGWQGQNWLAHRLVWTLTKGPIPPGQEVLHSCDIRACLNVGHMFLGTQIDNLDDMFAKRLKDPSKRAGNSKLTPPQVEEIRVLLVEGKLSLGQIAKRYKVTRQAIWRIRHGLSWKEVIK